MGILIKRKSSIFLEADDDDTSGNAGDATTTNNDDGDGSGTPDNTSSEDTDTGDSDAGDDSDKDDNQDDDDNYDIDSEPDDDETNDDDDNQDDNTDGEEGDDSNDDNGDTDDSSDPDDSGLDDSDDTDSEEKQADRELFETLSPAERRQKIKTQKTLFLNLYNECTAVIDKYDTVINTYEEISEIGRNVISTLYDLKKAIVEYVTGVFSSNSYLQNDIQYQVYLSVFNGVKMITKDVVKIIEDKEK